MKALVVGSGGREHAIAWKLAGSAGVDQVYVAPGNAGTEAEPKCRNVPCADPSTDAGMDELIGFAKKEGVGLTVVGPEAPLAAGIVDRFRAAGLAAVGPDASAARLESSKAFSKAFMEKHGVRTARCREFRDYAAAREAAREHFAAVPGAAPAAPFVVKADGLAAGKGVVVAADFAEADAALASFLRDESLGEAGKLVLVEDFLRGVEVSVLAAVSVRPGAADAAIVPFVAARDHKRRFEGARGPNTGGMGAVAPVPDFGPAAQADFRAAILEPTLRGMAAEGFDYRGFIFFGLMVDGVRCSLVEYNARLGDPETQAVLPLLQSDFRELCGAVLDGTLASFPLEWNTGACCAPVAVADGYPGAYRKGDPVSVDRAALEAAGCRLFAAGLAPSPSGPATSGGRVLCVSAVAPDAEAARMRAYAGLRAVSFPGMGFRTDIGAEKA